VTQFLGSARYLTKGGFMYYNYGILSASCLPIFGGSSGAGADAGAFYLDVDYSAANSSAAIGVRLMFL